MGGRGKDSKSKRRKDSGGERRKDSNDGREGKLEIVGEELLL